MLASHGRAEAPTPPRMRRHAHSTPPVDSGFMREVTETLSDSQLVQRCRAGDPEAWNELVERFSRYVYAICVQGFRLREQDAEDVFQEVFARAYEHLDKLRDDAALRPWLAQLTRRLCIDRLRETARERPVPDEELAAGDTD